MDENSKNLIDNSCELLAKYLHGFRGDKFIWKKWPLYACGCDFRKILPNKVKSRQNPFFFQDSSDKDDIGDMLRGRHL